MMLTLLEANGGNRVTEMAESGSDAHALDASRGGILTTEEVKAMDRTLCKGASLHGDHHADRIGNSGVSRAPAACHLLQAGRCTLRFTTNDLPRHRTTPLAPNFGYLEEPFIHSATKIPVAFPLLSPLVICPSSIRYTTLARPRLGWRCTLVCLLLSSICFVPLVRLFAFPSQHLPRGQLKSHAKCLRDPLYPRL